MAARNEHTGDTLISKTNTKEYEENYERIFGKKKFFTTGEDKDNVILNRPPERPAYHWVLGEPAASPAVASQPKGEQSSCPED